ncbi:hypothetical protein RhiJN_06569 [Ceratobasidium sp. AG-Ba]|nr:hypothetical protein RhiJN_06569 [Ceratobasidium sp. AG-Ba]
MSVATEHHPRSIFTWAALDHAKPANGSCSGDSNSTSSSSVMPASTSSSGKSSGRSFHEPMPSPALSDAPSTTWTTGTFSFPPCSSRTMRSLPVPPQKAAPSAKSTSRVINAIPGFDDFAELVMAAERSVPHVTVTPSSSHTTPAPTPTTSRIRRLRFHSQRAVPSEPKSIMPTPSTTASSLPWTKSDDGDGRVTFIFGRLKPARVRYSAPPPAATSSQPSATATTIFSRNPSPSLSVSPIPAPTLEPAAESTVALSQVSP